MSIENEIVKERTCATVFLLPGIGLQRQDILQYGFIAAYIDDINHSIKYKNSLYLLYKPTSRFKEFLDSEYGRTKLLIEEYDYPNGYVVVVYRFPKEFIPDYELFLEGKYSKFSEDYKNVFPKTTWIENEYGLRTEKFTFQHLVFIKHPVIREHWYDKLGVQIPKDGEHWTKPDIENKERLNIYSDSFQ